MIRIHWITVYLFAVLFLLTACAAPDEAKPSSIQPTISIPSSTPVDMKLGLPATSNKFASTPTAIFTPSEAPFQLFPFLGTGDYLVVGVGEPFALSLDGKKKRSLPQNASSLCAARVSPDGKNIALVASKAENQNSVFFRVLDTISGSYKDLPRVEDCITADPPGWWPDSTLLIYACEDKILKLSFPAGEEEGRIDRRELGYPDYSSMHRPSWSPDGKWIAFRKSDTRIDPGIPGDQAIVIPANCFDQPGTCAGNAVKFPFQGKSSQNLLDWKSSDELILLDAEASKATIYNVISKEKVLSFSLPSTYPVENFAVSPDGSQIAFGQQSADALEAAIYVASLKDGTVEKIYAEDYRIDRDYVSIWIKSWQTEPPKK